MKKMLMLSALSGCLLINTALKPTKSKWIPLFDGKTLNGWKVGEHAETFSVDSGCIIAHGQTAHLFYEGDVEGHDFKNFRLQGRCDDAARQQ